MALINIGNDPWLAEYESCDKLQREIMEMLSLRDKELKRNEQYVRLSGSLRLRLKQFSSELDQLKVKLDQESKSPLITYEEVERRSRQIELLRSRHVTAVKLFEGKMATSNQERDRLLGLSNLDTEDWGPADVDQNQTVQEIRVQQTHIVQQQERGLEELSKIISRQKNIAQTISDEVDLHNEIIDDLGSHVERTDIRVVDETQNVEQVSKQDRTCGYWVVIILLFISIIAVVAVN